MILKVIFANSADPDQTAPLGQMTFSDAGFLGVLRVNRIVDIHYEGISNEYHKNIFVK